MGKRVTKASVDSSVKKLSKSKTVKAKKGTSQLKKGGAKALKVHEAWKVLNPVVQNPVGEHKFTLVYLHGFGSSADAFFHAQFAGLSELEKFGVRVVLPNAPERKITYEKGEKM